MRPEVSILIPHYQTPQLTLLCLRLLRQRTAPRHYETIVIDNGSADGSGDLLRRVRWIKLLRRDPDPAERPTLAHGLALNAGLAQAQADHVAVLHTDTMILRGDWLQFLLSSLGTPAQDYAAVGSWKMEAPGPVRRAGKWVEDTLRRLRGRRAAAPRYLRSHCALYRRSVLTAHPAGFAPTADRCAGEELHAALLTAGHATRFLDPVILNRYVHHLNHATLALNDEVGRGVRYVDRTREKAVRRIRRFYAAVRADAVLADHSLDAA